MRTIPVNMRSPLMPMVARLEYRKNSFTLYSLQARIIILKSIIAAMSMPMPMANFLFLALISLVVGLDTCFFLLTE